MGISDELIITKKEYLDYITGKSVYAINKILERLLNRLPPKLREEAKSKEIKLIEKDKSMGVLTLLVEIPNASSDLQNQISLHFPFIICVLD